MRKYRELLVPVHFVSPGSASVELAPDSLLAVDQAVQIARVTGASITFTHAFAGREEPGASSDDGALPAIHAFLDRRAAEFRAAGVECRWVFLFGRPSEEIISLAASEGYDLIVTGTSHRPGSGPLIGSTAVAVLTGSAVPVWVARESRDSRGSVVVATDFSPISGSVLRHGTSLANWGGRELHVVHACQCPGSCVDESAEVKRCRAKMEIEMADVDHDVPVPSYKSHVEVGAPENVIWSVARQVGADLVVVGFHDRQHLERIFRGSTAERILRALPCSLMSVPR